MRRPDATPTIAEWFHRKEAAGRVASLLFAMMYHASLVAVALQTGLQRQRCYGETTKTPIADGKISGQSEFPGIRGGQAWSSRS
jgi:hypothetical protein